MTTQTRRAWEAAQREICTRKRVYLSQQLAENAAWLFELVFGDPSRPYKCPWCPDWHLTTHPEGAPP
jgi:hypothetical protein